jgi:hypothetical protein
MTEFEIAINSRDLSLFRTIESQSTDDDKRSLLACQLATRELKKPYTYLEIGSYLGGSIQPYLVDPLCERIFSIDKRPHHQPDERGFEYTYLNNSTARMLEKLSAVGPTDKIKTLDGSTSEIDPSLIDRPADLCFIDGEHTDGAVVADFNFCRRVLADSGAIIFHDATITYNGIDRCIKLLDEEGVNFRAYSLPSIVFVIEINAFPLHEHPAVLELLTNNYKSYIFSLQEMDYYRRFSQKAPFRLYRRMLAKWHGHNVFD